jgi:hypothetical protein
VRGCIVSPDLSVLNLVIVKKGEKDLPGLTDEEKPRMRGPKRASKVGFEGIMYKKAADSSLHLLSLIHPGMFRLLACVVQNSAPC